MFHQLISNPVSLLLFGSGGAFLLSYLKMGPKKLINLWRGKFIYTVKIEQGDEAFIAVSRWLAANYSKKINAVKAKTMKDSAGNKKVIYYQRDAFFHISYKGKKIIFSGQSKSLDKISDIFGLELHSLTMYGLNAAKEIKEIIQTAVDLYSDEKEENEVIVYTLAESYSDYTSRANTLKPKPLNELIYSGNTGDKLMEDLSNFIKKREWYDQRSIIWKRAYLLYGPPGTGKSTLIQTIARELKKDMFVVDLDSYLTSPEKLQKVFRIVPPNSILVFEDIDRTLGDPEKVKKLSLSTLMNSLDGPFTKSGTIVFMTANNISTIDPALFRDGRIDFKLEVPRSSNIEIGKYLSLFYGEEIRLPEGKPLAMATVQGICIKNMNDSKEVVEEIKNLMKNT